jgi:antitoxin ParD1/3/4
MATMTVPMPDPMRDWVEERARSGPYEDAGAYVRDLIRRDQERSAKLAELQILIDEGLSSGVSDRGPAEILAEARRRAKGASRVG